jgi:hypothetical protein
LEASTKAKGVASLSTLEFESQGEQFIVVTYEIRVFFEGAQKEVFSSIFKFFYNYIKA